MVSGHRSLGSPGELDQQLHRDGADIDAVLNMAPTDEKTEVVLPAEVPEDLRLPSDPKAACRRIAAQGEPLWKTTRSAEKSFANGWPFRRTSEDRRTGGGIRQKGGKAPANLAVFSAVPLEFARLQGVRETITASCEPVV